MRDSLANPDSLPRCAGADHEDARRLQGCALSIPRIIAELRGPDRKAQCWYDDLGIGAGYSSSHLFWQSLRPQGGEVAGIRPRTLARFREQRGHRAHPVRRGVSWPGINRRSIMCSTAPSVSYAIKLRRRQRRRARRRRCVAPHHPRGAGLRSTESRGARYNQSLIIVYQMSKKRSFQKKESL